MLDGMFELPERERDEVEMHYDIIHGLKNRFDSEEIVVFAYPNSCHLNECSLSIDETNVGIAFVSIFFNPLP